MTLDEQIKYIKKINSTLTSKDEEVSVTYKGTSNGITNPWQARCGSYEIHSADLITSVNLLFNKLKLELSKRTESLESQVAYFKSAINDLPEIAN